MIKYSQLAMLWYNLLVMVLYSVDFSNCNGNGTGLVYYPFSLSIIHCKPDIRQAE